MRRLPALSAGMTFTLGENSALLKPITHRRRLDREPDLHGAADPIPRRSGRDAVGAGRDLLRAARRGGPDRQRGDGGVARRPTVPT